MALLLRNHNRIMRMLKALDTTNDSAIGIHQVRDGILFVQ